MLCVVCCMQAADGSWRWRTNLQASSPYWRGWYEGLSDAFLSLSVPKMLLLAGTDRCVAAALVSEEVHVLCQCHHGWPVSFTTGSCQHHNQKLISSLL